MQTGIDIYRLIAENMMVPVFVTDGAGRIAYTNPAAGKVFGYKEEELIGLTLESTLRPQYADGEPIFREEPAAQHTLAVKPTQERIATFIKKDGSCIALLGTSMRLGQDGWLVFMHDIGTRLAALAALAESERRFRQIADTLPHLMLTMTPDGKVSYINERFRQYTGLAQVDRDGCPLPVHPDDARSNHETVSKAARHGSEYRVEHRLRAADGSYQWFLTQCVPLKDREGKILAWHGTSTDIHVLRCTVEALGRSRETLRLATEATRLGLWEYNPATDELVWDDANRRIYGVPRDVRLNACFFLERVHPDDRPRIKTILNSLSSSTGRTDAEFRIIRMHDGALRWVQVCGQPSTSADGSVAHFVGTTLDITESKLAEQRVREVSQRDALTGLPNRALLFEHCEHLLAMARRTKSHGALLFIDLDHFKPINDLHGHDVGDQILRQVAKRLLGCTREEDIVGRVGGDEFIVALPHPEDVNGPAIAAQHIIKSISTPYCIGHLQLHVSPSIGIALFPRHGVTLKALIKCADMAMYQAKKSGPGRYQFYSSETERSVHHPMSIETRLKQALERGELELHYQPMVDVQSRQVVGVEALLRLPVPGKEPLKPEEFLPVAEALGMIHRLGEWVAYEACRQHRRWQEAGLPKMEMAINIASQQFHQHRGFVACIADNVRSSGMEASSLQIELKESAVQDGVHETVAVLEELRTLGVRVVLDDFGAGYSSIGLLSSLPLDKLKIDRSFISRLVSDRKSRTIAETVLALGHSLKLQVSGQGIESQPVFDYLRERGCDQAQGYYFSQPMTAGKLEQWLSQRAIQ